MTSTPPLGIGVVGLGFMGQTHIASYAAAHQAGVSNRLVAVCDRHPDKRAGRLATQGNLVQVPAGTLFDPNEVRAYGELSEFLSDDGIDAVSLCTPTDTHVELATQVLESGRHLLLEKPVALSAAGAREIAAVAERTGRVCMPAMCMRFWPGWQWLRDQIRNETYGSVRSAVFHRLGSPPTWSTDFYGDFSRSGGALFDLHVHDADFVRWCFGDPQRVTCVGSPVHMTTFYHYPDGPPHVLAEGAWDHSPGWRFRMQFTVVFEHATVDYGGYDESPLVLIRDGQIEPVRLEDEDGYAGEVRHFLHVVRGEEEQVPTMAEAVKLMELLEAEKASLLG